MTVTGKKYIAVIDVSPVIQRVISMTLRNAGYAVETFDNIKSAQQAFVVVHPDVVISEYNMPDGDGLELCQAMRNIPELSEIPVIIVTAHEHQVDMRALQAVGVRTVLGKPFSPRQLVAEVQSLLDAVIVS